MTIVSLIHCSIAKKPYIVLLVSCNKSGSRYLVNVL